MSNLRRFSVSVESDILDVVDGMVKDGSYSNRSDALRAMIRHQAAHSAQHGRGSVIGVLGVVYDHHRRNLVNRMLHVQHDTPAHILGAQHFHLDHENCVETILLRGPFHQLNDLLKKIQNIRGIKHAALSIIAPAKNLK